MVVLLRFNQRVRAGRCRWRTCSAAFEPHDWTAAVAAGGDERAPAADRSAGAGRFDGEGRRDARRRRLDRAGRRPAHQRLGQEALPAVADARGRSRRRRRCRPRAGCGCSSTSSCRHRPARATPADDADFTIEVEKAFFIDGFRCTANAIPIGWNPLRMRSEVKVDRLRQGGDGARPDGRAAPRAGAPSRRRRAPGPTTSATRAPS